LLSRIFWAELAAAGDGTAAPLDWVVAWLLLLACGGAPLLVDREVSTTVVVMSGDRGISQRNCWL